MCDVQVFRVDDDMKTSKRAMDLVVSHFAQQCSSKVSYQYGKHQVKEADYIILASSTRSPTRSKVNKTKVCGFLLLQHNKTKKQAYIDVVCSNMRYGGRLIARAENFASTELHCNSIRLSALPHVVTYYSNRHQYIQSNNPCATKPIIKRKGKKVNGYRMAKCIKTNI
jgi:hypothetical protein